ncbi:MAG TPA: glucose-6-phosphate isomerase family protein [Terriglobales bacterium]|nr:glucose-6-phosphate isomerase family protein [Terriglobales bacterium]
MQTVPPNSPLATVDWRDGSLLGPGVQQSEKTLGQLQAVFSDRSEFAAMDPSQVVYRVQWVPAEGANQEGGLLWGNTTIQPGRVGDEYFMTHGHFHLKRDRAEFYATVQGEGMLVLMDENRRGSYEPMKPGSLHYINGNVAHRVVNTGSSQLRFVACWPTDAGHDYGTIAEEGFSLRVLCRAGLATVVRSDR